MKDYEYLSVMENTLIEAWLGFLVSSGMGMLLMFCVGVPILLHYMIKTLREREAAQLPRDSDDSSL